ncbi:antitoxin Xre/MbcA/ParS toxin-binding domain-containing protein [Paraburkholderia sp.]|uniref:antitoxin Xre/MbcA/ParS toxin-binding domain-containing protein n=1 Tax=Paraburkholderia sp. TaxID=1926495 RepID=UPI0025D30FD4|nr:antitoxin Xre/MbcA/ParS toxin-binding domain-containing protein [Paraburkholderia sp.]
MTTTAPATRAGRAKSAPARKERVPGAFHLFDFAAVSQATPLERIAWIRHGIGAGCVMEMAARMDISQDRLMKQLGLPRATIVRKATARQNLSTAQAERVIGLAMLIVQVQTMVNESGNREGFDAAHWLAQWFERPNAALGGRRPAELMDTVTGQNLVFSILAKLQSAAYA